MKDDTVVALPRPGASLADDPLLAVLREGARRMLLQAIEALSFVPNGSARTLRAGTITTVGAILLDIANPFFTEVARGIEDRLALDDYTLMLASSDGEVERESRYLRLFEEHGVLGMLVTPAGPEPSGGDGPRPSRRALGRRRPGRRGG